MTTVTLRGLDGAPRPVAEAAIAELRQALRGPLVAAGDAGYDEARRVWNGAHDRRPGLVVRATGAADVMDAVRFAGRHELLLAVRGGGHNVAGTGVCDGGIVLDLSALRSVRVDADARIAEVGPGATLGDLDRETQAFGLVAPAGIVSSTGVAGLTLGGGMGWVRRKHGLTIDNLLAVDVVTADGTLLHASEEHNADLFWAVRGGGGNFGVVTSFRFELHPLGPLVYFAAPMYPIERAAELLPRWLDFCAAAPDEVSSFFFFQTLPAAEAFPAAVHHRGVVVLPTLYAGPVEAGEKALAPLRQMGETVLDLSGALPFRALQGAFDWVFPAGGRYYWKTATLPALDGDAIDAVVRIGTSRSSASTVVGVWQMGGAVARVPAAATAYGDRSHPWLVNIDSGWSDPAEDARHVEFTRGAWEALQPFAAGRSYLHYGALEKTDQIRAAYGDNWERLVRIKHRYDPQNLFRVNQNIPPAANR